MGRSDADGPRMRWADLVKSDEYRGLWVALEDVRYDSTNRQPLEGNVVDADEDLAALCARIGSRELSGCSIHYCDDGGSGIRRSPL
ncbi:MAG: hypothetical protein JRI23_07560 [Deltaproteobacteria bacterium]|nr:hypothetical protein [Deltaproteobacteria bacterium]MBW2531449.1 hypothetical protein [Deltaproteobacteria bacterium]